MMEIVQAPSKLRVLVVEDNENIQALLEYLLTPRYDVTVVGQYDDALAQATESTFDVLLLDINLNEKRSGIHLLHTLRRIPEFAHTPAIALTAYALYGDRSKLMDLGFNTYVAKPFSRTELMRAMQEAAALLYPTIRELPREPNRSAMPRQAATTLHLVVNAQKSHLSPMPTA